MVPCECCRDFGYLSKFEGRWLCNDCLSELKYGIITKNTMQSVLACGGTTAPNDDPSPGWENAVRIIEDG